MHQTTTLTQQAATPAVIHDSEWRILRANKGETADWRAGRGSDSPQYGKGLVWRRQPKDELVVGCEVVFLGKFTG